MSAYTQIRPVQGGSLQAGKAYHDIPGEAGDVYRPGSEQRAAHIAARIDVDGKSGIDIGCSVGGLSFALAALGASMTGVDYDASAIATATRVAWERDADVEFLCADLTADDTWEWLTAGGWDFAVWLSQWMWLAKQAGFDVARGRLRQLSEAVPVLVFETAQGPTDGMAGSPDVVGAEGVRWLLESSTCYTSIEAVGCGDAWLGQDSPGRTVFACRR